MSETTAKPGQNNYGVNAYKPKSQWREATPCEPNYPPSYPEPKPCETIRERDSKETYVVLNTAHSDHRHSEPISKLAWILLGLATLLLLGSMLSNLLMVWTLARANDNTNNSNTNNSKEVITTTTTKEVIRVSADPGWQGDEYYYYAPAARW